MFDAAAVHAGELAVRPLVVDEALERHQLAFKHDLGVRRHHQVDGLAFDHLGGRAVEGAQHLEIIGVGGDTGQRRDLVDGRAAQHDRDLEILALRRRRHRVNALAVRGAGHVDRLLVLRTEHRPVDAPVVDAGVGMLADEEIVVGEGVTVAVVMQEQRQARQVDVVALQDHFLAGCCRHRLPLHAALGARHHLEPGPRLVAAHRPGEHLLVGIGVGQHREFGVLHLLDQDGLGRIGFHELGDLVDADLVLDAHQEARFVHGVDKVGKRLLHCLARQKREIRNKRARSFRARRRP